MKESPYTIKILRFVDQTFINEWKNLWKNATNANLYNSYEWFVTCLDAKTVKEYEIHACYKKDKLVALLPLQQYKVFGVPVWGTLNKDHLVDTAFLTESYDKDLLKYFFNTIFKERNIYLQKVDKNATDLLHTLYPDLFITLMSVNPIVNLKNDPLENLSSSNRYQLRKLLRINEGKIQFKTYDSDLEKSLETLFALQKKSSKNARSMDIFENESIKKYYQSLTKNCKEFIRINFIYFEKTPIAYEYGCLINQHYAGDQISFLNEYKKISPGKLMMYHLFTDLREKGVSELDMGGGISNYKMSFTKDYRILYNIYYSKNIFVLVWWKTINTMRRIKQMLFPKKFTRDHEFLFRAV